MRAKTIDDVEEMLWVLQDEIFRLDFLPPYSPDLNPIERVWKLTRRLCLHNVYFPKLDQVRETAERQF
jgi:transposase